LAPLDFVDLLEIRRGLPKSEEKERRQAIPISGYPHCRLALSRISVIKLLGKK